VDKYEHPHVESKEQGRDKLPAYQNRYNPENKSDGKKRWLFPLVLVILLIAGAGAFWLINNLSEGASEQDLEIAIPAKLFAGEDLDQVMTFAVEEQGVAGVVPVDDGSLIYTMSSRIRDSLLAEAENELEEKLAALQDNGQDPFPVDLSYDSAYKDFLFRVDRQYYDHALQTAVEVYVMAVYYHHFYTDDAAEREVTVTIEDYETGETLESIAFPDDLNRAAAMIESPEEFALEPQGPAAGDKVIVSTGPDNLNLRNGPQITYLIIDILRSGTVLEVTGTEGAWLEVITPEGLEGWVHGDFVEPYDGEN